MYTYMAADWNSLLLLFRDGLFLLNHTEESHRVRGKPCKYLFIKAFIYQKWELKKILFKKPTRRTNYPYLFCYKILQVSGILSAHHQEFSTVRSALVSFMQVLMTVSKQSQGSILALLGNGHQNLHETYQYRMYSRELVMMGREDARNM